MSYDKTEPHRHNYFPFQKQADFEPTDLTDDDERVLYRRVEYMLLTCACGHALKRKVETDDNASGNSD